MFTLLTTWISERIITVTAVSVLTVAAVPTTLVIVSSNGDHKTTVAVVQPVDAKQKVVLIGEVKKAGDAVIAKLNNAESSCNGTVATTVSTSKVAPAKIQSQLATAKTQIHGSVSPFVAAILKDEDRFAHLTVITPQDEENELHEISLIQLTALGDGHSAGTVTITCQTIVITITQTIQITITPAPVCPPTIRKEGDD
ncbi:MAG: hypothetical protein M3Z11_11565 [Candidatus Dormibacteraeota bacterium]|nr:hypothetical protein [Candidatus Dormibacteraeota bacterium]